MLLLEARFTNYTESQPTPIIDQHGMRRCIECGVVVTGHGKKKFCGTECTQAYHLKRKVKTGQSKKGKHTKECVWCGEVFTVRGHGAGARMYCSPGCQRASYEDKKMQLKIENARSMVNRYRDCENCGATYQVLKHQSRRKYCSYACRDEAFNKSRPRKQCIICGEWFSHSYRDTCSDNCKEAHKLYRQMKSRLANMARSELSECKRNAKRIMRARKERAETTSALRLWRGGMEPKEIGLQIRGDPRMGASILWRSRQYRRRSETRRRKSTWLAGEQMIGYRHADYPSENSMLDDIQETMNIDWVVVREKMVRGWSKVDMFVDAGVHKYMIEAKASMRKSRMACALGQAVIAAELSGCVGIVCLPVISDDQRDYERVANASGIIISHPKTIRRAIDMHIDGESVSVINKTIRHLAKGTPPQNIKKIRP